MKQASPLLARIREITRYDSQLRERGFGLPETMVSLTLLLFVVLPMILTATLAQLKLDENDRRIAAQTDVVSADIQLRSHLLDYRTGTVTLLWPDEVPLDLATGDNKPIVIGTISGFTADGTPVFSTAVRAGWDNYAIKGTTAGGWSSIYDRATSKFYKVAAPSSTE
ncbi:hypothetical protein FQ330_03345 [Agrococcus sediminis]|uniref:Uncharacterized protein n=1 Tax=Agrococcus sediminis TaxID=2599924 RepID=A0A5M8QQI7_9MICO|nr:hypothetical protein [Agrococcus sediminis]KAA6436452.1 hypothetical protein FQ330_03345 [Agrococcus sediminis]